MNDRRFLAIDAEPAYLRPAVRVSLAERAERAAALLGECRACPRNCGVNRATGELGYCGVGRRARVASAFAHFGEENCLRGTHGSGTIFFSGCNLHCAFCQNWDISQRATGQEVTGGQLAALMLALQDEGCHNINLVTPSHVVPQAIEALALAVEGGLRVPIVYNSGGYDALPTLQLLDGLIDIYMPDFKFWTSATAERLANAPDYPEVARTALVEMQRQVGDLCFRADGVAVRGLLVRHLVLPGLGDETSAILGWLAEAVSPGAFVNIMGQYHPEHDVGRFAAARADGPVARYADLNRRPWRAELEAAYAAARAAGLWRFDRLEC